MWARSLSAQQPRKTSVIGFLHPGFSEQATGPNQAVTHLRDSLTEIGYTEGQTIGIQERWGRGKPETLAGLAEDLVRLRVDVLVAVARPSIEAAKAATKRPTYHSCRLRERSGRERLCEQIGGAGRQPHRLVLGFTGPVSQVVAVGTRGRASGAAHRRSEGHQHWAVPAGRN
jgi:hypothetical protein